MGGVFPEGVAQKYEACLMVLGQAGGHLRRVHAEGYTENPRNYAPSVPAIGVVLGGS